MPMPSGCHKRVFSPAGYRRLTPLGGCSGRARARPQLLSRRPPPRRSRPRRNRAGRHLGRRPHPRRPRPPAARPRPSPTPRLAAAAGGDPGRPPRRAAAHRLRRRPARAGARRLPRPAGGRAGRHRLPARLPRPGERRRALRPRPRRRRPRRRLGRRLGWGKFPGHGGMALLSRLPIDAAAPAASASCPGASCPARSSPSARTAAPSRRRGAPPCGSPRGRTGTCRWRCPDGRRLHLLASNPTPPLFDGPEGLNRAAQPRRDRASGPHYLDGAAFRDDAGPDRRAPRRARSSSSATSTPTRSTATACTTASPRSSPTRACRTRARPAPAARAAAANAGHAGPPRARHRRLARRTAGRATCASTTCCPRATSRWPRAASLWPAPGDAAGGSRRRRLGAPPGLGRHRAPLKPVRRLDRSRPRRLPRSGRIPPSPRGHPWPTPTLLILPGDGIGPEVMAEVRKVIAWFGRDRGLPFAIEEDLVGGCAYDAHGTPLTDAAMAQAQAADAVLLGAVGGPKYDELAFDVRSPSAASCACARRSTSSPTSARRSASTRSPTSPRSSARWSTGSTSSSSAS